MCGIVGYLGQKQAIPIVLEGLKRLEYRGYDSAGIAALVEQNIYAVKKQGVVSVLENNINQNLSSRLAIAHTRWATHGEPSDINAHPHCDCQQKIYLAHNGIIENYQKLKKELTLAGHKFRTQTDTEVLAHLIEKYVQNAGLEEAVQKALDRVEGTYGIVVISAEEPEKLIAARAGSPLLIGVGEDEFIVASDASAIIQHTKKVVYLNDKELVILTPNNLKIIDLKNQRCWLKRGEEEIDWTPEQAQKNGYAHFMLKEIFEQPESIKNSIRGRLIPKEGMVKLGGLENVNEELKKINRIIIVACGTASYAARVGEYMLEEYAGIPVEVEFASEFRYRKPILSPGTALLAVSQSGETADTLAAIREAKRKSALTLGIINTVGSTIARETDAGIYNHIGPEIGVASTKAFVSQITILALVALLLGRQRELSLIKGQRIIEDLLKLEGQIQKILSQHEQIKDIAKKYTNFHNFLFLGRKYNFPIALEGALKLKEISYAHAEGYASGEMKHGPIAMISPNFPSVFIAPQDSVYKKNISNIEEVKARNGQIIAIANEGDENIADLADDVFYIPKTSEMLTPILAVVPLQLFAYYIALERGCPIDKPRNLAKSVTVE